MRKLLLVPLLFIFMSGVYGQEDSVKILPTITIKTSAKVMNKLNKIFKQSFPGAENLRWYKLDKDYLAQFMAQDMEHNALFRENGYLKYDIAYGYEDNLPNKFKRDIMAIYPDCSITRVFNLKGDGRDVWVVNLETLKNYYQVQLEEGDMNEVQKLVKSE